MLAIFKDGKTQGLIFTDRLKTTNCVNYITCRLDDESKSYLNGFYCGINEIDRYVKEDALDDTFKGNGVTYLVIDKDLNNLVAYYTLSTTAIQSNTDILFGIPSVEIKMFAVNRDYQDTLYLEKNILVSDFILGMLIGDLYRLSFEVLGFKFIVLHSVDSAVEFYKRNSFWTMEDYIMFKSDYEINDCIPMYMRLFEDD